MREDDLISSLVGRVVLQILVNDDESIMVLITDGGEVILQAEGKCCSETWFADFLGVDALLGQRVLAAESIDLPGYNVEDGRGRQDEDQVYGHRFTTARGYADLIYRNSSNGYYGGSLEQGYSYDPQKMRPITADWSA